jgi:hypothetical protein
MRWRLTALCAAVFGLLLLVLMTPAAAFDCPMTTLELSSSPETRVALNKEGCTGEALTPVILLQSGWHAAAVELLLPLAWPASCQQLLAVNQSGHRTHHNLIWLVQHMHGSRQLSAMRPHHVGPCRLLLPAQHAAWPRSRGDTPYQSSPA